MKSLSIWAIAGIMVLACLFKLPAATVFPIATNATGSQAGLFATFGGTNYLFGIQGDGTTDNTNITAQLVTTNGAVTGSRISIGRKGGIPYVAFAGTNYVLVWSDSALVGSGGNDQVYGQFISRSGVKVGAPFTFGPMSEEQDMQGGGGSLLASDGNNFLVVWDTGPFHDAPYGDVHAAMFNGSGALVKPIIDITTIGTSDPQATPAVAFGRTNYLVVWNDVGNGYIDGEFVSTNGTAGSPFVINQTPTYSYNPLCAAFDGTNFLVVWNQDVGTDSTVWNLYGQLVSPDGTFPGGEVAMVTDTNQPVYPSLAFGGGSYLLVWNEGVQAGDSQLFLQYFQPTPALNAIGPEFNVFSTVGSNAPLFGGVLFDRSRFVLGGVIGSATGINSEGLEFTSGTSTWGAFLPVMPTVQFTATPAAGSAPLTVQFNSVSVDSQGNAIKNWNWSFGDGATSSLQNPAHVYTTIGTFTPTLIATNDHGIAVAGSGPQITTKVLAQNLFVSELQSGAITEITSNGMESTFASGLNHPSSLAFDRAGDLFESDYWSGEILKFTPQGTMSTFATLSSPFSLAINATGNLFVGNSSSNIVEITPTGVQSTFASLSGMASSLAFDNDGNLFAGDFNGNITEITQGGAQSTFVSGFKPRDGLQLAFNSAGYLFVAELDNISTYGLITEIATNGAKSTFISGGLFSPGAMAFDSAGNLLMADYQDGNIYEFRTNGTQITIATGLGAGNPLGLALQPGPQPTMEQGFTNLYNFTGLTGEFNANTYGADPFAGVIVSGNVLFGTTTQGGAGGNGTIFALNTDGTHVTTLHNYSWLSPDAGFFDNPQAGLVLSGNTLYGAEIGGGTNGNGAIISLTTNGSDYSILYNFSASSNPYYGTNFDGSLPENTLILSGGTLIGTADGGGLNGVGTIFGIKNDGTDFTNLYNFTGGSDGGYPNGLIVSGNILYGSASNGGTNNTGTIFKINADGTGFTILHTFAALDETYFTNSDGANPFGALVLSGNTLYGTASSGGAYGNGNVFALDANGSNFLVLHTFTSLSSGDVPSPISTNLDGANPTCALLLSGQVLYGTAHAGGTGGSGTVFELGANGGNFSVLHTFSPVDQTFQTNSDGAFPQAGLFISNNILYGTTYGGGVNGVGTVFSISLSVPIEPQLAILHSGTNIILTWPANANGFLLQTTANLTPPVVWSNMTTAPVVINGRNTVTNTVSTSQIYYRLSQ